MLMLMDVVDSISPISSLECLLLGCKTIRERISLILMNIFFIWPKSYKRNRAITTFLNPHISRSSWHLVLTHTH